MSDEPVHMQRASWLSGTRHLRGGVYRLRRSVFDARLLSVLVVLVVWQAVAQGAHISPTALPSPISIATSWWDDLRNFSLLSNLAQTLKVVLIGFVISALLGVAVGVLMGFSRFFRRLVDPYITLLLAVPFTAMVPALVVWIGVSDTLPVAVAALFAFPLVVANSYAGVREVDTSLLAMASSFEARPTWVATRITLPAALPSIIVGLQQGLRSAVKGVVLAEMLATYAGLGSMVVNFGGSFRSDHLLAVVFTLLVVVLVFDLVVSLIRRLVAPWSIS